MVTDQALGAILTRVDVVRRAAGSGHAALRGKRGANRPLRRRCDGEARRRDLVERSVFGPVFAGQEDALPRVFRDQFLLPAGSPYDVVLEGAMERVWHRPPWLWPLFWLMGRANALFPDTGRDIPFRLVITSQARPDGTPVQRWQRTFDFGMPRRFDSELAFDERRGRVVERVGPGRCIEVGAHLQFQAPRTLVMETDDIAVRLSRWRWRLPGFLGAEVHVVHQASPDHDDVAHIQLTVTQPLLGQIFGYEGTFRVRQVAHGASPIATEFTPG